MGKDRPILFSGAMVQAILGGRKSVTRRVVNPQPVADPTWDGGFVLKTRKESTAIKALQRGMYLDVCPYGEPGDALWVKEALVSSTMWDGEPRMTYAADGSWVWDLDNPCAWVWKRNMLPSMFMPKGLSRFTLPVVSTRPEQLLDITDEEAVREGAYLHEGFGVGHSGWRMDPNDGVVCGTPLQAFLDYWDRLNAKRGYGAASNPWVWRVEFEEEAQGNG